MRSFAIVALLSAATLGCGPGVPTIRSSAWLPPNDSTRPLDCSDLQPPSPAGSVGDPLDPGRGKPLHQPNDLGAGPVRLVWSSTVAGVRLDWVAPAVPEAKNLWLLRAADSGRCVVGTWNASGLGFQVIRHVFWNEGHLEIVLLGLGLPPRQGWMVLVTDGSTLWSGLVASDGRPGALVAEQVEFRQEADRLRLVVVDGGRTAILDFDGRQFSPRP
jgi:hypothetical protein